MQVKPQGHRMVEAGRHLSRLPSRQGQWSRLPKTVSSWVLNISKNGDSTTSLGNLFWGSVTFSGKKKKTNHKGGFSMFKWNFPYFRWCALPLVLSLGNTKSLPTSSLLPLVRYLHTLVRSPLSFFLLRLSQSLPYKRCSIPGVTLDLLQYCHVLLVLFCHCWVVMEITLSFRWDADRMPRGCGNYMNCESRVQNDAFILLPQNFNSNIYRVIRDFEECGGWYCAFLGEWNLPRPLAESSITVPQVSISCGFFEGVHIWLQSHILFETWYETWLSKVSEAML